MANVPKTVAPAKELWARLRKTFFVERWRRSIHGLDLLRCFTADELRTALRHPRTREQTLDVGKSVTIEGDAKDLRVIVVLSGSLKVYLRSAEVTVDGRTKRASNPLIDASRLSYTGGVTSIGSRSGKRLAIAPKEATHVRVGSVPERGTFGSMQALTGKKWDKTAVCAERDTRILSIPAAAFAVVIGDRPSVTDELARVIAWRTEGRGGDGGCVRGGDGGGVEGFISGRSFSRRGRRRAQAAVAGGDRGARGGNRDVRGMLKHADGRWISVNYI